MKNLSPPFHAALTDAVQALTEKSLRTAARRHLRDNLTALGGYAFAAAGLHRWPLWIARCQPVAFAPALEKSRAPLSYPARQLEEAVALCQFSFGFVCAVGTHSAV